MADDASPAEQLAALAAHGGFRDEATLRWDGVDIPASSRRNRFCRVGAGFPASAGVLTQMLYDLYVRSDDGRGPYAALHDRLLQETFAATLASVNASRWSWAPGWRVTGREEGRLRVENGAGALRFVAPEEFAENDDPAQEISSPEAGTLTTATTSEGDADPSGTRPAAALRGPPQEPRLMEGMIRIENGTSWSQPGWYHVRGERDHPISSPATVRMYWNPCAAGAAPLVAALTQELNGAGVPFHAKVVDDPQRYTRADGGVLYLPRSSWSRAAAPLARAYERVAPYLKSPTPLLTKRLAPGLAVADDPGGDESFGMQRMRLVAEGLWNACAVRRESPEDALRAVDERFIAAGLDPARPHLRAKAAADYELAVRPRPRVPFAEA